GLAFVQEHPWLTMQRDIIKFFDFWGLERELIAGAQRGYFGNIPPWLVALLAAIICVAYVAILFLGIYGLFLAPLSDRRVHLFLFLMVAYVCALHTVVFGHSRYHLPVMPLVMVFAASAVVASPNVWRQWQRPKFWLATMVCMLMVF